MAFQKIKELLEKKLGTPETVQGTQFNYPCPFCHQSHLHVNYVKGACICHHCKRGSRNLFILATQLRLDTVSISPRQLAPTRLVAAVEHILYGTSKPIEDSTKLPKDFLPVPLSSKTSDVYGKAIRGYLHHRGVVDEQIQDAGIGYCCEGRYSGCIVFPVFMMQRLRYFTTRRVFGPGPKTVNPVSPREAVIFNLDRVWKASQLVVVEGPISAYASENSGFDTVAVLGHIIKDKQADVISKMPNLKKITVAFDPDVDSYVTLSEAHRLMEHVSIPVFALSLQGGDPAELSPGEYQKQIWTGARVATGANKLRERWKI